MSLLKTLCMQCTLLTVLTTSMCLSAYALEIEPTTTYFSLRDYMVRSQSGDWDEYAVSGFYEPGISPKVHLLPRIRLNASSLTYIDMAGRRVPSEHIADLPADNISVIKVALSYDATMPNREQGVGIADEVRGQHRNHHPVPLLRLPSGAPAMAADVGIWSTMVGSNVSQSILDDYNAAEQAGQQGIAASQATWTNIHAHAVNLNQLVVKLVIDGDVVAQRQFPGTTVLASGRLPELNIKNVTPEILNRLRGGTYEVNIDFMFKDSKVANIDATVDYGRVMDNYIEHTRSIATKTKNTSAGIFNFSHRKSSMSQSINEQIKEITTDRTTARTEIVMDDATETMVARFEANFFPVLNKQSVIDNHLKAAEVAKSQGSVNLAKAHLDYATALQQGDPKGEIDAVGAAAALGTGNYAMFVAKGMKFTNDSTSLNYSFHKILSTHVEEGVHKEWHETNRVSVNRMTTMLVTPEPELEYRGYLGLCSQRTMVYPKPVPYWNPGLGIPPATSTPALMVTCVTAGSPIAAMNIIPGNVIERINGTSINSLQEFQDLMLQTRPGDTLRLTMVQYGIPMRMFDVNVKLKKGLPVH